MSEKRSARTGRTSHDAASRRLANDATVLDLVVPDAKTVLLSETIRGVEDIVRERNALLHVRAPENALLGATRKARRRSGVLVLANALSDHAIRQLAQSAMPTVLVHRASPQGVSLPTVGVDNEAGMFKLVSHLIERGYRQIAFLGGMNGDEAYAQRWQGFRRALHEAGIPRNPRLELECGATEEHARHVVHRLLRSKATFTALAASSDERAMGALLALTGAGLRISGDVALARFSDAADEYLLPVPVPTVRASARRTGYIAGRLLLNWIREGQCLLNRWLLPTTLFIP